MLVDQAFDNDRAIPRECFAHLFGTGSRVFDVHAAGSGGLGELAKSKNTICSPGHGQRAREAPSPAAISTTNGTCPG